jgi:predicted nucleic acid-binding Zn ribbon protein
MSLAQVPEHGHCEICQTPVKVGERFCGSKVCEDKHQENIRTKKRQMLLLIAVLVGVLLINALGRIG